MKSLLCVRPPPTPLQFTPVEGRRSWRLSSLRRRRRRQSRPLATVSRRRRQTRQLNVTLGDRKPVRMQIAADFMMMAPPRQSTPPLSITADPLRSTQGRWRPSRPFQRGEVTRRRVTSRHASVLIHWSMHGIYLARQNDPGERRLQRRQDGTGGQSERAGVTQQHVRRRDVTPGVKLLSDDFPASAD